MMCLMNTSLHDIQSLYRYNVICYSHEVDRIQHNSHGIEMGSLYEHNTYDHEGLFSKEHCSVTGTQLSR